MVDAEISNKSISFHNLGIVMTEILMTSSDDRDFESAVEVFPNPTNGLIEIVIDGRSDNQTIIQLYSIEGRKILDRSSDEDNLFLNVSDLINGMYLLELSHKDNQPNRKVVIQLQNTLAAPSESTTAPPPS